MQQFWKKAQIRVGCAARCDLFVQKHCAEKGYYNVIVYVPIEKKDEANIESEQFHIEMVAGKFKDRDRAMQKDCHSIVAVLSQYAGQASGTAANIIAIAAKNGAFGSGDCLNLDGYAVVELLRKYSVPFNVTTQTYVAAQESLWKNKVLFLIQIAYELL